MNTTPQNPAPGGPGPHPADPYAGPTSQPRQDRTSSLRGPGASAPVYPQPAFRQPVFQQPAMKPLQAPWWQREGVVSKLIVLTGGAITLIGVVMLLVIAAHAGLLNPQVRVGGGAALSVLLIAAALRVHGRPGGSIGGVALAGTGIAGLFIVTVAMTSFYEWIPALGGLALAGVIAAAAAALAVQWRSELLAIAVTVAVAALAPVLTDGVTAALVWFMVILQAAGIVPERIRNWGFLGLVRPLPAMIVATVYVGEVRSIDALPAALAVLALATVSFALPVGKDDELHSAGYVMAALPVAALLPMLDRPVAFAVGGVLTAALAVVAGVMAQLPAVRRIVLGGVAVSLAVETCFLFTHDSWLPVLVLVPGVVVTAVGFVKRSDLVTLVGVALGGAGAVAYFTFADPSTLASAAVADARLSYVTLVGGLLLAGWAVLGVWAIIRSNLSVRPAPVVSLGGVVALYGATAAMISFGSDVGATAGFHSAHVGVTVVWITVAMSLLAVSLRMPRFAAAAMAGGLLLAGCSIAKLFLFDLQEMSGATRAITFIVVGLVMLFAGSRYAQAFARMRGTQRETPVPPAPAVQH